MTNLERLRSLPPEKLAEELIQTKTETRYDEDENFEGDLVSIPYEYTFLVTPSGEEFEEYGYEEAVRATVRWLNSECRTA